MNNLIGILFFKKDINKGWGNGEICDLPGNAYDKLVPRHCSLQPKPHVSQMFSLSKILNFLLFSLFTLLSVFSKVFYCLEFCSLRSLSMTITFAVVVQSLSPVQISVAPLIAASWLPHPLLSPGVFSSSSPLSWWCYLTPHLLHSLLLLPSIFPSTQVFSNESALCIRWPKYWGFRFSISPSNEYSGLISFRMDWFDLLTVQGILKSLLQQHSSKASILLSLAFFIV